MKKFLLTLALVAVTASAWADGTPKKPSCSGFVSNGFWDNMEISVGGGAGIAISNGKNLGSFGDRLGFEANFSLTKWIHPVAGLRLQLQGGQFANFDPDMGKMKWPYMFVHSDLLINFSNWAGGYRDDRAYYLVPFLGFGYMATNFTEESHEDNLTGTHQTFAFSFGLLNKFRLSRAFDFNIELKSLMAPTRVVPAGVDGAYLFGLSATAGFTYRFNQRGWMRGAPGYTIDDIMALQEAVAANMLALEAAQIANAALADDLMASQAEAAAAKAAAAKAAAAAAALQNQPKASTLDTDPIILFDINMATLTPQEKTRLELVADKIKSGPKDMVYKIQGHADQQTGTAAFNQKLSVERAKRVFDFLVSKGVDPKQLTYEGFGGVDNPFPKVQKANRSAIVQ